MLSSFKNKPRFTKNKKIEKFGIFCKKHGLTLFKNSQFFDFLNFFFGFLGGTVEQVGGTVMVEK